MIKIGEIEKEGSVVDIFWDNDKPCYEQSDDAITIFDKDIRPYMVSKDTGNNNYVRDKYDRDLSWDISNKFCTFHIENKYESESYTWDIVEQIIKAE